MKPRTSPAIIFAILAAAVAAFSLLQTLLNPVLPTIQADLHTDASTVTWVLTAWLLSAAIATPILGRIGDMVGKSRTLVIALVIVAIGSVVCAIAPTIGVMIIGRVLQGLGGAVFPLSFGIMRDEFRAGRVASAVGAMSAISAIGGGVGIVIAGPIVSALGWRWLFWIPMIVILAAAIAGSLFIPASPVRSGGRINWVGALLLSGWLVALLLPLSEARTWGWGSPLVIGLFAIAAILIATWIVTEYRSNNPLIDMRMLRLRGVWTANLVGLCFGAAMFAVLAFLPRFAQTPGEAGYGFAMDVTQSGALLLPLLIVMAVAGFASGPLAPIVSSRMQLIIGSAATALGCAVFVFWHGQPWQVALVSGMFGLGIGFAYAAIANLVVQSVPAGQTGVASGMSANIRTIGGALGTAVVSAIVTGTLQRDGLPTEGGYISAFVVLIAISVVAVGVAILVPVTRRARTPEPEFALMTPAAAEIG